MTDQERLSFIAELKSKSSTIQSGQLQMCQADLKLTAENPTNKLRRFIVNPTNPEVKECKVILMVGATGAGKTTLVNALMNHIFGIRWEDPVRFKVVPEDGENTDQAKSMTKCVSVYDAQPSPAASVPFALKIIDTPGFGDTQGMTQDEEIVKQIKHFLAKDSLQLFGVDRLDAVCLVAQSARPRLTTTQKYIYDSVLALFGKDVASNIFLLCTFADDKAPPVMEAIKEAQIPFAQWFPFNNCALFTDSSQAGPFSKLYWNMCEKSIEAFMAYLSKVDPCTLELTRTVLHERHLIKQLMEELVPKYNDSMKVTETIRHYQVQIKLLEAEIKSNEKYTMATDIPYTKRVEVPVGQHVTSCLRCNVTCHYPCNTAQDEVRFRCVVMKDKYCFVCPNNCPWYEHANTEFYFDQGARREVKVLEEVKKAYDNAVARKSSTSEALNGAKAQFSASVLDMTQSIAESFECFERICADALLPDVIRSSKYAEILIEAEKVERRPGFMDTIKRLEEVKTSLSVSQKIRLLKLKDVKNKNQHLQDSGDWVKDFFDKA